MILPLDQLVAVVTQYTGDTPRKRPNKARPSQRQLFAARLFAYAARELLVPPASYPAIAAALGRGDHTTAIWLYRTGAGAITAEHREQFGRVLRAAARAHLRDLLRYYGEAAE